jgi:NADPH:quinone reductase-like Zn-dependent oxidoreductase
LHPALLDSALHAVGLGGAGVEQLRLPFAWSGVSLYGKGASELRVALTRAGEEELSLAVADRDGAPVASVGSLALRPVDSSQLQGAGGSRDGLLGIEWRELETGEAIPFAEIDDLASLDGDDEAAAPPLVLWRPRPDLDPGLDAASAARAASEYVLGRLQGWLGQERLADSRLVLLTENAVAAGDGESPDLAEAALLGLLRSAQSEHPGRFGLIDGDGSEASGEAIGVALALDEPQLALREGVAMVPRATADRGDSLLPPAGPWHLDATKRGTLESLALVPSPGAAEPLGPSEVRIAMRAAGLNFRDVLIALGVYPGEATIGGEGAGVVEEVGSAVADLAAGDRVMGLVGEAFAPLARTERRLLTAIPAGWSFEQAAAVPSAYLTAHLGLFGLAGLKPGEKVLIHAGAGGVGLAAIGLAQQAGAEVFATASPAKWDTLREAGIAAKRIASSRDLAFKDEFLQATGGEGVDVVLNSLAGEYVDASLELLPRGGRFLEIGKTDLRDPEQVKAEHPGVSYHPYDVLAMVAAEPGQFGQVLDEVLALFERGDLKHSPISSWDVRRAPQAFRHLREGNNVGKVVLGIPAPVDPERTTLVSGGTGGLGALVARHLVEAHGARNLLLVSRSGEDAEGALQLRQELEQLGATVDLAACDVSRRESLEELLGSIPAEHPLGAVIHAAGALDDGTIESLDAGKLERVFAPKADAAWHLHELTAGLDLSVFVLFSSAAGVLGAPGQGNYAAANSFLDALAARRQAEGLAATSIAWGLWRRESAMTAHLGEADLARIRRSGLAPLSDEAGLALFDQALGCEPADALALATDRAGLRAQAAAGTLPAILGGLVRAPLRRRAAAGPSLAAKLAGLDPSQRREHVLGLVLAEVATVLGHGSAEAIEPRRAFKELGFDSLAAVELRNRLTAASGLRLPATVVFDHPNPAELAAQVLVMAGFGDPGEGQAGEDVLASEFDRLESSLAGIESADRRESAAARLRELLAALDSEQGGDLAGATDEEMFDLLDKKLGRV